MLIKNVTVQVALAAIAGIVSAYSLEALGLLGSTSGPEADSPIYDFVLFLKSTFLAALRMLIAPLIFFSLIGGITGIGNVVKLRTLGSSTVIYYFGTTFIAISLALFAVFFIHPWTNYPATLSMGVEFASERMIEPGSDSLIAVLEQIFHLAFTNPFSALVNLNILGIVTNAFLIGIAMVLVLPQTSPVFGIVKDLNLVIHKVLGWIIRVLPIGIFAILFDFTIRLSGDGEYSGAFLTQLFQFASLVVILTLIHGLIVLPAIAYFFAGRRPVKLLKDISRPLIVAFSTSSSAATLPVSMKTAQEELEIDESVSSFVLPLGATMNMDGTALFEAVAAIFLAYLYGIELSNLMIFTVFLMSMISSIGAPGMPTASMAGMQMVLLSVGIPLEAIAILLVIERPLDTIRTAVNVEGDLIGTLVVQESLNKRIDA
ncbi:MAG: dicarboxylate/amino acid:cation symporter [Pseudomonadales bacterium]